VQALGDDGGDGRKRILDAVVQLFKDQLLKLVGRLALSGVDTGLGKQTPRIDLRLRQEKPQANVLGRQKVLVRFCAAGALSVRRSTSSICNCITLGWVPHLIFRRACVCLEGYWRYPAPTSFRRDQSCCASGL